MVHRIRHLFLFDYHPLPRVVDDQDVALIIHLSVEWAPSTGQMFQLLKIAVE